MVHAFKGYLGVGYHASSQTDLRQTAVARTLFSRFHDLEVTESQGQEIDPTSGRSEPESVSLGNYDAQIRGTLEGTTEGPIVPMFRSVLGGAITTSTVGTTGKQHEIVVGDTLPSAARLSAEVKYGTLASESEVLNCIVKRLRFNAQQQGYARWEFEAVGGLPTRNASPTSPTYPAVATLLSQRKTTFSLGGVTTRAVRGFTWEVGRVVDEDDYDVTARSRRDAEYGEFECLFDAEVTFADMTDLRRFWGAAASTTPSDTEAYYALNIKTERFDVIAGGTAVHSAILDAPKVFLTGVSTPLRGRDQIRQRIQGRAIYDSGASKAVDVKLINTVASY